MQEIIKKIGYNFKDESLLKLALTHPSTDKGNINNQRLEFLGDAVLELIVSNMLYKNYKDMREGDMSKLRSAMVCEKALARLAQTISLGKYIIMDKSVKQSNGHNNPSIISDAMEATIAAIYLDGGIDQAAAFIQRLYAKVPPEEFRAEENTKGVLQEYTQAYNLGLPEYKLIQTTGPAHNRSFTVALYIGDKQMAQASSGGKKSAEQKAAQIVLHKLKKGINNATDKT